VALSEGIPGEEFSTALASRLPPAVWASAQSKGAKASNENIPAIKNFFIKIT
jgi:hypothetical protein